MAENMSYHVSIERKTRVANIIKQVGLGQIVKKKYVGYGIGKKPGRFVCITDTGVTIIKDETEQTIITMYITTQAELVAVFGGKKKIPGYLMKKVDHNQSLFTKNGKTIWKE